MQRDDREREDIEDDRDAEEMRRVRDDLRHLLVRGAVVDREPGGGSLELAEASKSSQQRLK